jgi:hypothetical protein
LCVRLLAELYDIAAAHFGPDLGRAALSAAYDRHVAGSSNHATCGFLADRSGRP